MSDSRCSWRSCIALTGVIALSLYIGEGTARAAPQSSPSTAAPAHHGHRVLWTVIGIGAGFAAGTMIGLHAFDDATNSDRKVWMSAISGAAAGGVVAAVVTRPRPGGLPVIQPAVVDWLALREGTPMRRVMKRLRSTPTGPGR